MGRSAKTAVFACYGSLLRMLLLSPIFLTIIFCFWAAYDAVLPLSSSLLKEYCFNADHTDPILGSEVPKLKLAEKRPFNNIAPSQTFLSIDVSHNGTDDKHVHTILRNNAGADLAATSLENAEMSASNTQHTEHQQESEQHDIFVAINEVQRIMKSLRRAARSFDMTNETNMTATAFDSNCDGKRAFIYNLPAKFNVDLLNRCLDLIPWQNMCDYFSNSAMGKLIEAPSSEKASEVLVPSGVWYKTHQYSLEILFHERLKHYKCLTTDAELADMFYIPYYGGLDVLRWHFLKNASHVQRDKLGMELIRWLKEQPTWRKNEGVDHVLVLGKITWDFRRSPNGMTSWGSSLLLQDEMQKPTMLLIERDPWRDHEVGVPHPTFFHPRHDRDIRTWQGHIDSEKRNHLVSFAGMPRPKQPESIRSHLIRQCVSSVGVGPRVESSCQFLDCDMGKCWHPNSTMELFIHSEFCLQPPGDSPTRRSVFDSLIAGCIPVLFDPYTAYNQYPWHLPEDTKVYSVYFPAEDVREGRINVIDELRKIPMSVRQQMRRRIIYNIMPGLVYARPNARLGEVEDAFIVSLRGLFASISWRRRRRNSPVEMVGLSDAL